MNQKELAQNLIELISNKEHINKLRIESAWNNFYNYCVLKNCRPDTLKYYKKHYIKLEFFFKSINIHFTEDINKHNMNMLLTNLKNKKLSNNTINKYIETIKSIIKYNYENEYTTINNIRNFKKLPQIKNVIKTITTNNELQILEYMNNLNLDNKYNLRYVVALNLFRDSGIRLNELLNIEIKNINIEDNSLLLTFTKTKTERYAFYSNNTKELLKKYLDDIKYERKFLFSGRTDRPMNKQLIYDFLNRITDKLGIEQSISPHKWRHTLSTKLIINGVNIESVRKILGHSNISTTQLYLHLDNEQIKKDLLKVL